MKQTENNMRILVDQDGVLADYASLLLERIRENFPELPHVEPECMTHFNTERHFPKEYHKKIDTLTLEPDFFPSIPLIKGAKEALEELRERGHDVWICTKPKCPSRDQHCVPGKLKWINEHLGGFWADRTILTRDKTLVQGDVLIDDHPNAGRGFAVEPSWEHVLYDQPYNRYKHDKRRLTWETWKEVLEK